MKRLLLTTTAAAAAAVGYRRAFQPWHERWGATDEEVAAPLPGDDLIAEPAFQLTRAVTVDAPASEVWPWLVQLGADRGGFYSYDWLEDLFGLGIHSADQVVAGWQDLAIGDVVTATRSGAGGWYVVGLWPEEALVLQVADLEEHRPVRRDDRIGWEFQWTFALRPTPGGSTRLLVRERVAFTNPVTRALMAPVGIVSFAMTRRMLLGIKQRAEASGGAGRVAASRSD